MSDIFKGFKEGDGDLRMIRETIPRKYHRKYLLSFLKVSCDVFSIASDFTPNACKNEALVFNN